MSTQREDGLSPVASEFMTLTHEPEIQKFFRKGQSAFNATASKYGVAKRI